MTDVFISYAREDTDFVKRLYTTLEERKRSAWVDWEGILPSAEWLNEIYTAINSADAFVFVISASSVTSEICLQELQHAVKQNKRLIPLLREEIDDAAAPETIKRLNWIFFREGDDFDVAFASLVNALETNLDWVQAHTRLLVRAADWERRDRDNSLLLRGRDLEEAERWITQGAEHEPKPTGLQIQIVTTSRQATNKRQRLTLTAVVSGLVIALVLAAIAWEQRQQAVRNADIAETRRIEAERRLLVSTAQVMADEATKQLRAGHPERGALLARQAYLFNRRARGHVLAVIDPTVRQILSEPHFSPVLVGHSATVNAVAYSHNGEFVASAAADNTVRVWNVNDETRSSRVLTGHSGSVNAAVFSPDDRMLASASADRSIRLWDIEHPDNTPKVLTQHGDAVTALAISRAGDILYSADSGGTLLAWNLTQPRPSSTLLAPVAFPGGPISDDTTIYYVGAKKDRYRTKPGIVSSIALSPDGKTLATADLGGLVMLWDVTGKTVPRILRGGGAKRAVTFSPDGKTLAVGTVGFEVHLWDLESKDEYPRVLEGHRGEVKGLAFSPNGAALASTGGSPPSHNPAETDRSIRLWNLRDLDEPPIVLHGHTRDIYAVAFSPDGNMLVSGGADRQVRLWDLTSPVAVPRFLHGHETEVWSAAFAANPNMVISSAGSMFAGSGGLFEPPDTSVRFWALDANDPTPLTIEGSGGIDTRIVVSNDGSILAASDKTWELRDLDAVISDAKGKFGVPVTVSLSPDNKLVASAGPKNSVKVVNIEDPDVAPLILSGHKSPLVSTAFAADGKTLVSADDKTIRVWDLKNPKATPVVIAGHGDRLRSVVVSPAGKTIAAGSAKDTVALWSMDGPNQAPTILRGHEGRVWSVRFSPDGQTLATGASDATVRLWNLRRPDDPPIVLRGHDRFVRSVNFSHDGEWLVTASDDKTVAVWPARTDTLVERICKKVWRNLTLEEWRQFVGRNYPYERTCADIPAHRSLIDEAKRLAEAEKLSAAESLLRHINSLDDALDLDPKRAPRRWLAEKRLAQGNKLAKAGKVQGAIEEFKRASQLHPELDIDAAAEAGRLAASAPLNEGEKLAKEGKVAEAITKFKRALEFDQGLDFDPNAWAGKLAAPSVASKAESLARYGKVDEAITKFNEALELDPKLDIDPKAEAGRLAAPDKLRDARNQARAVNEKSARALFARALELDSNLALDIEAELTKYLALGLKQKGDDAAATGDKEGSAEFYRHAMEKDPTLKFDPEAEYRKQRARALIRKSESIANKGDYDRALAILNQAKEVRPELSLHPEALATRAARALYRKAEYAEREDKNKAIDLCRRVVALNPEHADAWFKIGWILMGKQENKPATEAFERYVELKKRTRNRSNVANAQFNLGILYYRMDKLKESELNYLAVLKSRSFKYQKDTLARLYRSLALVYKYQDRFEDAETWFAKSLALRQELGDLESVARIRNDLGDLLIKRGRYPEAKAMLTEALALANKAASEIQAQRAQRHLARLK